VDTSVGVWGDRVVYRAGIWVLGLGEETPPPYPQFVFRRGARQVPPLAGLSVGNGVKGSSCAAKERCDAVRQQSLEGIGERKVEDDLALEDLDAGADLQEAQTDGVELRAGQRGALQESATERVHENVGGAVEEQSRVPRDSNL